MSRIRDSARRWRKAFYRKMEFLAWKILGLIIQEGLLKENLLQKRNIPG